MTEEQTQVLLTPEALQNAYRLGWEAAMNSINPYVDDLEKSLEELRKIFDDMNNLLKEF